MSKQTKKMKEKNLSSKQSTNTTEPNNDFIVGRDTPLSEEIRVVVNRETIKELPTRLLFR